MAVKVAAEAEEVDLERGVSAVKRWPRAYVHHASKGTLAAVHRRPYGVDTGAWDELQAVFRHNVGRGETHAAAFVVAADHAACKPVAVAQAHGGHPYFALGEERAYYRRAYLHPVERESVGTHHVDAHLAAVAHVVFEALRAVAAEAVVVTRHQGAHVQPP